MKYKAVCFDVDGTLYPTGILKKKMLKLFFWHPFLTLRYGKMRRQFRQIQSIYEEKIFEGLSFTEREWYVYKRLWQNRDEKKDLLNYYSALEKVYDNLKEQKETILTLEKIKNKGLCIAFLTDWPFFSKLKKMGLDGFTDSLYYSGDCGYLKPDVRCFEMLLQGLSLANNEVLFVGDSYEKDIRGAYGAGIDSVLIGKEKNKGEYSLALNAFKTWSEFDAWLTEQMEM